MIRDKEKGLNTGTGSNVDLKPKKLKTLILNSQR